jgi:tetrapyrrole methylase family protein / MazG family protein
LESFQSFTHLIQKLRAPGGCPWDIEQTFQSLKPYIIEEAYELFDALESENPIDLKEELGDVLLHVVMLSNMAEEKKWFTVDDVIKEIHKKMVHRHPHVFGNKKVNSVDDVWKNWDALKEKEKKTNSIMDSVPKSLPSLLQAYKIQKRAAKQGFDWDTNEGPLDKLDEEVQEFKEALNSNNSEHILEEAGDVLFSIVNILRKYKINPEFALKSSNEKFLKRYKTMEKACHTKNISFKKISMDEKEELWKFAKQKLKQIHINSLQK